MVKVKLPLKNKISLWQLTENNLQISLLVAKEARLEREWKLYSVANLKHNHIFFKCHLAVLACLIREISQNLWKIFGSLGCRQDPCPAMLNHVCVCSRFSMGATEC